MSRDQTDDDIRAAMEAVQARPWPRTARRRRGQAPSDSLVQIQFRMRIQAGGPEPRPEAERPLRAELQ
jgi:hypothetical protein